MLSLQTIRNKLRPYEYLPSISLLLLVVSCSKAPQIPEPQISLPKPSDIAKEYENLLESCQGERRNWIQVEVPSDLLGKVSDFKVHAYFHALEAPKNVRLVLLQDRIRPGSKPGELSALVDLSELERSGGYGPYALEMLLSADGDTWYSSWGSSGNMLSIRLPERPSGCEDAVHLEPLQLLDPQQRSSLAEYTAARLITSPQNRKVVSNALYSLLGAFLRNGAIIAVGADAAAHPYHYNWPRDSFIGATFMLELFNKTGVGIFRDLALRHREFVLGSDLPQLPSAQRVNPLGYALYPDAVLAQYQLMPWPQHPQEHAAWSLQHDGPAHMLKFFRLAPGSDRNELLRDLLKSLDSSTQRPGRDLWEEIEAKSHIYTSMLQLDALMGLSADSTQELAALDDTQALKDNILRAIQAMRRKSPYRHPLSHLDLSSPAMERKIRRTKSTLLDSALIGAFVNMHGQSRAEVIEAFHGYQPLFDAFIELDRRFIEEYPINKSSPEATVLWGRYPNDPYNGHPYSPFIFTQGGPWVISSLWRARFLLTLAEDLKTVPFTWDRGSAKRFREHLQIESEEIDEIGAALRLHAKDQFNRVTSFLTDAAPAPEQLGRRTGAPGGVNHLVWTAVELIQTAIDFDKLPDRSE